LDDSKNYIHKGRYWREIDLNGNNPNIMFMVAYKGLPMGERKGYVMDILSNILGVGQSSYLNQRLVKGNKPTLSNVTAFNYGLKKSGVFFVSGELLKNVGKKEFKKEYLNAMHSMCNDAINVRSIQKTKNQILISYYDAIKTNAGVASFLGNNEYFFGDYKHYEKDLQIYDSIDEYEAKTVCKEMFSKNESIFVTIWNQNPVKK
jgi:zinc protease